MTPPADQHRDDTVVEAAASAFRERDALGRVKAAPAWYDLSLEGRQRLFEQQLVDRAMERTIDAEGQSATAKAVLVRLPGIEQLGGRQT